MQLIILDDTEMLEEEFQKWHSKQVSREDALCKVENIVS